MGAIDVAANITLCNQSLGLLGATQITLGGDTQNHTYCETFFTDALYEILAAHKWNFAKTRTYAIQTTDPLFGYDNAFTKPSDCIKVWKIEQDPLAEFEVEGNLILTDEGSAPSAWATATDYIAGDPVTNDDVTYICAVAHTSGDLDDEPGVGAVESTYWTTQSGDYEVLEVEYVYQHVTVSSWPIYAKRCAVLKLAMDLCSPIKQDMTETFLNLQASLYGGPKNYGYLGSARTFDAQEGGGETIKTSTWLDKRK